MEENLYFKNENGHIEWSAYEFAHHEKSGQWLLSFWIISAAIFFSLIIMKNIVGAATMAFFAVIAYVYATKKPEIIKCEMEEHSMFVNEIEFPYNNIDHFWIIYEPEVKELLLVSTKKMVPKISVSLNEEVDPVALREMLLQKGIKEKEIEESMSDVLARRIRF